MAAPAVAPVQPQQPKRERDTTPPPTPEVNLALAYAKAPAGAEFIERADAVALGVGVDPTYLELSNVEAGTTIEMINLSSHPDATFKDRANVVALGLTGRNVWDGNAAVHLDEGRTKSLGLRPGDQLAIRAVDQSGNASPPVLVDLDPAVRAGESGVVVTQDGTLIASKVEFLERGRRVPHTIVRVTDVTPPVLKAERVRIERDPNSEDRVKISLLGAAEPSARVRVKNSRTGGEDSCTMPNPLEEGASCEMWIDGRPGDTLLFRVTDVHGQIAPGQLALRFDANKKIGHALPRPTGVQLRRPTGPTR